MAAAVDDVDVLGGVWTSAGLALIRDEADPMRKGGSTVLSKDVLSSGEVLARLEEREVDAALTQALCIPCDAVGALPLPLSPVVPLCERR